jgi:hypothetical protein
VIVDRIASTHPAVTNKSIFIFSADSLEDRDNLYLWKEEHMRFENAGRRGNFKSIFFCLALMAFMLVVVPASFARPDNPFDLSGPKMEMYVTRGGKTLPIADVSNLQPDDRLWIHVDLPDDQAVHYLLVVAFLRGSTNPPPENWFTRAETWNKQVLAEGTVVTVPKDAQQAILFLAPETGGDFSSLRSAVRSKPGVFVRASQDLNQASLDRTRADRYLADIKNSSDSDPKALHDRSVLLARTLGIKLDEQCFNRPVEQQSTCLTQNTDQLVLDDGHTQSMVAALTSGPTTDLMGALSSTPMAGGGSYSPYVGAVVDVARILGNLHTAAYQYIPALALPRGSQLSLRLNNPPSFRNPKSVLVVGLPAVEAAQLPPLRSVNLAEVYCLQKAPLVLPTEGAPLVFSTDIAHDFVLQIRGKDGTAMDLPAIADAARGGFLVDARSLQAGKLDSDISGTLRGYWGFDSFEGPTFHLRNAHSTTWRVAPADQGALIVGRVDTLHVQSDCVVCIDTVTIQDERHKELGTTWKALKPDELEIQIPLKDETSGSLKITVKQFGVATADELLLQTYAEAAELDYFKINAGDAQGILRGTRLDEVNSFELKGIRFVPTKLSRADKKDELQLAVASSASPAAFQTDEKLIAHVDLKDGRVLDLQTTVEKPRPRVKLISKSVQPASPRSSIHLKDEDELPQDGRLSFFLKTEVPENFPRTEKIEVSSMDDSFHALLSVNDGNLILQNSQTLLAVLDPLKTFGPSAFGPLRFRPVEVDGGNGDWQPLATLVRIPTLKEVRCPESPDKQCRLSGSNLFLIDSVASDPQFTHAVSVPVGFADSSLSVPRPNGTLLYVKLRDNAATVDSLVLPVLPDDE